MPGAKRKTSYQDGLAGGGKRASSWALLFLLAGISACGPLFPKELLKEINRDLTSSEVIEDPESYTGDAVLWGGVIRENIPEPAGTRVVIDQAPLDVRGYPQIETTLGEFIAHTPLYLDPQRYRPGRKITVAGTIDGVEERQMGVTQYPRPVLEALDIYLWDEKLWGVFPISRGWKVDQTGPIPSPFENPYEQGSSMGRSFP
jgi:outer membrane lipoprotein